MFRPRKSTIRKLIIFTFLIYGSFDKSLWVEVVITLLFCLKYYINGRKKFVKDDWVFSNHVNVPSRVPHGGHFSSLFYSLFVNFITSRVSKVNLFLYADYVKIFHRVKPIECCILLENELILFSNWVSQLGFSFNLCKYHVISFFKFRTFIVNS